MTMTKMPPLIGAKEKDRRALSLLKTSNEKGALLSTLNYFGIDYEKVDLPAIWEKWQEGMSSEKTMTAQRQLNAKMNYACHEKTRGISWHDSFLMGKIECQSQFKLNELEFIERHMNTLVQGTMLKAWQYDYENYLAMRATWINSNFQWHNCQDILFNAPPSLSYFDKSILLYHCHIHYAQKDSNDYVRHYYHLDSHGTWQEYKKELALANIHNRNLYNVKDYWQSNHQFGMPPNDCHIVQDYFDNVPQLEWEWHSNSYSKDSNGNYNYKFAIDTLNDIVNNSMGTKAKFLIYWQSMRGTFKRHEGQLLEWAFNAMKRITAMNRAGIVPPKDYEYFLRIINRATSAPHFLMPVPKETWQDYVKGHSFDSVMALRNDSDLPKKLIIGT